jgi:hypothetical protein
MTTTARTDIHRPVEMDPATYEFLTCFDNDDTRVPQFVKDLCIELSKTDRLGRGTWQCHHCGARIRYVALMRHTPTSEVIAVGETCLDNGFALASKRSFDALRKAASDARKEQRIVTAARAFLATQDATIAKALNKDTDLAAEFNLSGYGLNTVSDIRRKLWIYGSCFPRQIELVAKLIAEVPVRAAKAEAQEAEVNVPAPVGRVAFTGRVVSRKFHDNDFGGAMKITVKVTTEAGTWLCWVTEPRSITSEVGDMVTMTATLTPSNDKPHFAFGKRPSNASVVEAKSDEAPSALD